MHYYTVNDNYIHVLVECTFTTLSVFNFTTLLSEPNPKQQFVVQYFHSMYDTLDIKCIYSVQNMLNKYLNTLTSFCSCTTFLMNFVSYHN